MGFMFLPIKWKPSNIAQHGILLQSHPRHRTTMFSRYLPPTQQRIHKVPTWQKANTGTCVSGPQGFTVRSLFPLGTHLGREIINGLLFIDYFSSSSYSPTICGFIYSDLYVPIVTYRSLYFIFLVILSKQR